MRAINLSFCLLFSLILSAQPTFQNEMTIQDYVLDVFQGTGVVISTISMNGIPGDSIHQQIGTFQNNGSYIPISQGLVMSTGGIVGTDFNGDTIYPGGETTIPVDNGQNGDSDLELLANDPINDQAILEFDVIPSEQYLLFNYSFASEEYPEYVNSFNDAFGFFVSGPGISGPYSNGAVNIALLPDSITTVSIDNLNNGNNCTDSLGTTGPCMNCMYYIDNCNSGGEFDGLTTNLMAAIQVTPGETYHFKLAIGDALDTAFDSAVFLQEYSFRSAASIAVGLPESELLASIYPNPSSGKIILEMDELRLHSLELYDLHGKQVWSDTAPSVSGTAVEVDLGGVQPGNYLLRIMHDRGVSTQQVNLK
jgi:hypothetical protein